MKRARIHGEVGLGELLTLDMARYLVFLHQQSLPDNKKPKTETDESDSKRVGDVFECKTCGRRFSSFQALGGHRASHKLMSTKPTSRTGYGTGVVSGKLGMHECSICGLGFSMGQALGGHMRKHRTAVYPTDPIPVLNRTSSSKRITCLNLDLNLTPLENDLRLLFGDVAPTLKSQEPHCQSLY